MVYIDDASGQFMRGGYLLRFNNIKSLLSDLILTYKMRHGEKGQLVVATRGEKSQVTVRPFPSKTVVINVKRNSYFRCKAIFRYHQRLQ